MVIIFFLGLFFSFFLIGHWGLVRLDLGSLDPWESRFFGIGLGACVFSVVIFILASCQLITVYSVWVCVFIPFFLNRQKLFESFKAIWLLRSLKNIESGTERSVLNLFCGLVFLILFLCSLTLTLVPATGTDALVYHLAVPKAYLQAGGIVSLPNNIYSFFPLQFEMLYLLALAIKGETLAQLLGLGMSVMAVGGIALFYKRYFSSKLLWVPCLIFFSTPTFWEVSFLAYVDFQVAGFILMAVYAWARWREEEKNGWFVLMSFFSGMAIATKLSSLVIFSIALLGIVLVKGNSLKKTLIFSSLFILAVFLFLVPWWARNLIFTGGNPFAPYLIQFFGGDGINWDEVRSSMQFDYYQSFGMGKSLKDFFLLPWNLTFYSEKGSLRYDGQIGILYLLSLPFLAIVMFRRERAVSIGFFISLLIFCVFFISWFFMSQYIRLLTISFIFLSMLMAFGLETVYLRSIKPLRILTAVVFVFGLIFNGVIICKEWLDRNPFPVLFGTQSRDYYLESKIPSYPIYKAINNHLLNDDKALLVYLRNYGFFSDKKFFSDTFFEGFTLKKILEGGPTPELLLERWQEKSLTHLAFDFHFVFGKDSVLETIEREALKNYLNMRGRLIFEKNGFYLYAL
jgi:hypothetical protein